MKEILLYEAFDGKRFSSKKSCEDYEKNMAKHFKIKCKADLIFRLDNVELTYPAIINKDLARDKTALKSALQMEMLDETCEFNSASAERLLEIAKQQKLPLYFDIAENVIMIDYWEVD
jgi:hypothetical protein